MIFSIKHEQTIHTLGESGNAQHKPEMGKNVQHL